MRASLSDERGVGLDGGTHASNSGPLPENERADRPQVRKQYRPDLLWPADLVSTALPVRQGEELEDWTVRRHSIVRCDADDVDEKDSGDSVAAAGG